MDNGNSARLGSLSGMKIIALMFIFILHSDVFPTRILVAGRCCEFFFVCSGFLVAYNHAGRIGNDPGFTPLRYVKTKLCVTWPLHFVLFIINGIPFLNLTTLPEIVTALLNIFLLQSWSSDRWVSFSYNGSSWFLSALLFCYMAAPLLIKGLKTHRRALISFICVAVLRETAELFESFLSKKLFTIDFQTFPIIRCMEFYLGMCVCVLFFELRERHFTKNRPAMTAVETLAAALTFFLVITMNDVWIRGHFVLIFCVLTLAFSFGGGYLSMLLSSKPFMMMSLIETEFYLLHSTVLKRIRMLFQMYSLPCGYVFFALSLAMALTLSIVWKKYVSRKAAELMNKALDCLTPQVKHPEAD